MNKFPSKFEYTSMIIIIVIIMIIIIIIILITLLSYNTGNPFYGTPAASRLQLKQELGNDELPWCEKVLNDTVLLSVQ